MKQDLFETVPVPRAYFTLALPVVLSMLVALIYNMVDTYFIALTGNTELVAGVSLSAPVFTLMIAFGDIWGLGGSSLISVLLGKKEYDRAESVSAFAFWTAVVFGICVTAVMLIFRTSILAALGAADDTISYASAYYSWIAIGAAAIILGLVPTNILRTEGLAGQAMLGSMIGSAVNIILDPVCIFTFGLGAAGAAIATVTGNLIADVYYVYVLLTKSRHLSIDLRRAWVSAAEVRRVLAIGIPASVTNIMQSFSIILTNHFLLAYGTEKVAAMGIALKVNMISAFVLVGFAFGGQPLIGYCYGAGNKKRLRDTVHFAYGVMAALAAIFTLVMCPAAPVLIRVFMDDTVIVRNGALMLRCLQISMVCMAVVLVSTCICQSLGKAAGAFVLSFSRQGVLFAVVIFVMSHMFGYMGVLLSQAASDLITAVVAVCIVRHEMSLLFAEEKQRNS